MVSKYSISNYFQKSINFLFPLCADSKPKDIMTYLFCDKIDEDIFSYYIIVKVNKGIEITDKEFLSNVSNVYSQKDFDLYILDISKWEKDVNEFLKGNYSKFSKEVKHRILKFYGYIDHNGKLKDTNKINYAHFFVYLYPEKYKEAVAEELVSVHKFFNTYEEALNVIKESKELCPIYDLEKETLILNIDKDE